MPHAVNVFCGSSSGAGPEYDLAAQALGRVLVEQQLTLVYGGSRRGLMGALADAVLARGGTVVGVIPRAMMELEVAHPSLSKLHVVGSMHERKAMMADLSDLVIALPGGYGTLDELCEILTWTQLGIQRKPCGILNVNGYFNHLLEFFDHAVTEGFLDLRQQQRLIVHSDSGILVKRLLNELS